MYHSRIAAKTGRDVDIGRLLVVAAMLFAFGALAYHAEGFIATAVKAINYPFQLDYGEGIVWQQAQQMRSGNAYGDITGFPAIVFHYPPLYHVIVFTIAEVTGLDFLVVG